jgi:predicted nuclease with TOPRIM domain
LNDPLQRLGGEIKKLEEERKEQDDIKDKKEKLKKTIEIAEQRFRKLEYEYEVKLQQFTYYKRDRDYLFEKFNNTVYEIH